VERKLAHARARTMTRVHPNRIPLIDLPVEFAY